MKLLRYGPAGAEKPGMLDEAGKLRDLSAHVPDITGAMLDDASLAKLRALDPESLPLVEGAPRPGPCVGNIGKFMCIGLNYSDHAEEAGMAIPKHLSQLFTLHPADVMSTGTPPPGVGMWMKPEPVYLKKGDVMELRIEGLGEQRQRVDEDA